MPNNHRGRAGSALSRRVSRPPGRRPPYQRVAARAGLRRRSSSPGCGFSFWLLIVLCFTVVGGYIVYDRTFGVLKAITRTTDVREHEPAAGPPPALLQQPFNVLLIGVDARPEHPEAGVRSDTLIVVRVDPVAKWAAMLSIPRDSFVKIPYREDVEGTKITLAYTYGFQHPEIYGAGTRPADAGQALAADTVEEFLGLTIDYTAQVDPGGFETVLDALGGIVVDVPHAMLDAEYPTDDFGYQRLLIEPGLQRMDGHTALLYARTRHVDNDFGRSRRQQQVLQSTYCKVKGQDLLKQVELVPHLLDIVQTSILTNLPLNDLGTLRGLAVLVREIGIDQVQRMTINPDTVALDERFDNRYDIHWQGAAIKRLADDFERGPTEQPIATPAVAVQVQNGTSIRGVAAQLTLDLQLAGITTVPAADAPTLDNPHTLILDYADQPALRARLAELLDIAPAYIQDKSANPSTAPLGAGIVVVLGDDYTPPAALPTVAPTPGEQPPTPEAGPSPWSIGSCA